MDLRIYEYSPDELDEVLSFRNQIFQSVDKARWEAMNCTAVAAREGERLVGFIPLQYRRQVLRPGATIPVVYENAVGVADGERGRGIGSRMLEEGARLVADRANAMMVIRGGERSDGYRFYRKTGHGDVCYMRSYELLPERAWPAEDEAGFCVLDRTAWLALEPALLALYEQRYGAFGGGQERAAGYWRATLEGHIYGARKWWFVTYRPDGERLSGYLIAAHGLWEGSTDLCVYEVVGEDGEAVQRLLRYARRMSTNGCYRVPLVSLSNPICALLCEMGFIESESTPYVMARILRPDRIFRRLADGSDLLDTLSLAVSTPHRTLSVNEPAQPRHTVRLETKENLIARLFCCRLNLEAAVAMEMVRWDVRDAGLGRELCQVFAPAEWVLWLTDFV